MLNWIKNTFRTAAPIDKLPTAMIEYMLNDPLTPNLKTSVEVPLLTDTPRFFVQGWKGFSISDIQKQAGQVYACLNTTMNMVKSVYNRPLRWAATEALIINPRAGRGCNAFYDRAAINFMFDEHPITKKIVYTAESVNVVAHEFGHAILDGMRPDLWNVPSLEIFAFHEAFGDIISMLCTLQHDQIIDCVLKETNNNPRNSNVVSRIAEEMGNLLYAQGKRNIEINALRNAANDLVYIPPETLPQKVEDLSLSQEPHSFSRVFSGAWFDCLVSIYEQEVARLSNHDAMKKARDVMTFVTINAMSMVAVNPRFYTAVAKSMLSVAQAKYGNQFFATLRKVFLKRKLITGIVMSNNQFGRFFDLYRADLTKIHNLGSEMYGVRSGEVTETSLLDLKNRKLKHTDLPLNLLKGKLEIPMEIQYTLDSTNRVVDELSTDENYVNESVLSAVDFLYSTGNIDVNNNLINNKCFCIKEGKLVRQRSCLDTSYRQELK